MLHRRSAGIAVLLWLCTAGVANAAMMQLSNLFVFGDSLSDGGNSALLSQGATGGALTFPPYPYVDGRYSNGPVAAEYLWQLYNSGSALQPSLGGGTNYAIGGATSGVASYIAANPGNPALVQTIFEDKGNRWQLDQFATASPTFNPDTSLFFVWFFANDIFYSGATSGGLPGTALPGGPVGANLIENGILNVTSTISYLASQGARHFLVPNLPDLGLTPEFLGDTGMSSISSLYNLALAGAIETLKPTLTSVDIILFDIDAALKGVIANAASYGITNTTEACIDHIGDGTCNSGNWDSWLFWDGVHPTTRTHQILAGEFQEAVPEPANLLLIAIGLAALVTLRRRWQLMARAY